MTAHFRFEMPTPYACPIGMGQPTKPRPSSVPPPFPHPLAPHQHMKWAALGPVKEEDSVGATVIVSLEEEGDMMVYGAVVVWVTDLQPR